MSLRFAALVAAGFSSDFNGEAYATVSGQNSNNSVRVPDAFMRSVQDDGPWQTTFRTNGKVHETLEWRSEKARIVVEFDDKGNFLTSEFYYPGRDPVTNVAERLKWDREKFARVKKYVEERKAATEGKQ